MNNAGIRQGRQHIVVALFRIVGGFCLVLTIGALAGCQPPPPPVVTVIQPPSPVEQAPPPPPAEQAPPPPVVQRVAGPGCDLPYVQRGRSFIVEAWAVPDAQFNVGEPLSIQARVSTPAYLNMFHVSTSCKVTRLLHNVQLQPAEIADFPRQNSRMIIVKPPTGEEAFYLIATREPMAFVAEADILQGGDGIASLDLSPAQFYQRLEQVLGRINPDDLSVATLKTSIVGN